MRELRLRSEENDKSEKNDKKSNKNNRWQVTSYAQMHAFIPWLEMLDDIGFTASSALVIEEEKKIFNENEYFRGSWNTAPSTRGRNHRGR